MQLFVDIDLRKSIVSPGDRSAAATIVCSSQDTLELDVYFCQAGAIIDVGAGAALRFGIFASSALTVALDANIPNRRAAGRKPERSQLRLHSLQHEPDATER